MSGSRNGDIDHDEAFALLPWYANRTLDAEQTSSVARHIRECGDCRREARLLASLHDSIRGDAEERCRDGADTEAALADVLGRIDAETRRAETNESWPASLRRRLGRILSSAIAMPDLRWSATALAGLLIAVLGFQLYHGEDGDYSVLSSPDVEHTSLRLAVEATPGSDPERTRSVIESTLAGRERRADINTTADGGYVVELGEDIGVDELNELMLELENEAGIERVELVP